MLGRKFIIAHIDNIAGASYWSVFDQMILRPPIIAIYLTPGFTSCFSDAKQKTRQPQTKSHYAEVICNKQTCLGLRITVVQMGYLGDEQRRVFYKTSSFVHCLLM